MWNALFAATNLIALVGWALLVLSPRGKVIETLVLYLGAVLLCLIYTVLLVLIVSGTVAAGEGGGSFTSIAGIRAIFASDAGVVTGWTHYLALDLFVGLWIAKDADAKAFSRLVQAPVLLLTFVAGPAGLLLWMIVRERRARAAARGKVRRL